MSKGLKAPAGHTRVSPNSECPEPVRQATLAIELKWHAIVMLTQQASRVLQPCSKHCSSAAGRSHLQQGGLWARP